MAMRKAVPEEIKSEILSLANNRCCDCQTPFVQLRHTDGDPSNNDIDNIAPLCPYCHSQAHSQNMLTTNLTASRLKTLRDRWYSDCENRKEGSGVSENALLKLKNLVHSWRKMFSTVNPEYADMSREDIISRIFSTSNRDDLAVALETVKNINRSKWSDPHLLHKFQVVCNAFGIGYDEL